MRYAVMVEPQRGMTYEQLAGLAQVVEASGFEALHRADHLASFGDGPERDATEAWTTVAGLARETTTLRPGMLVSPITFRHPALVARMATTVDWMSGGRLEVGLGAGWVETEHRRNGLPFPPASVRTAMLGEAADLIRQLWAGGQVSFAGRFFRTDALQVLPPPVQQPHPPLLLGGRGGPVGLDLAARHADEYNFLALSPGEVAVRAEQAVRACEAVGRDPMTLRLSVTAAITVADAAADLERRIAAARRETGDLMDRRAASWIRGGRQELLDRVGQYS